MGTDDHFRDTREMLEWGFGTYGLRDRWMRPFFAEQGGAGVPVADFGLSEGEERRLGMMPALDDGRWRLSALVDLPKGALIGEWLKDTVPVVPPVEPTDPDS